MSKSARYGEGSFEGMQQIEATNFMLLGAPITEQSVEPCLKKVRAELDQSVSKLGILPIHHAFQILQASFGVPRLVSIVRCSSCYDHPILKGIDSTMRRTMEMIFNVKLTEEAYLQASLPVSYTHLTLPTIYSV